MDNQKRINLQVLIQRAKRLASSHEVILLTSNKEKTKNQTDYTEYSVTSEFLSEDEETVIIGALHRIGFSVRQFHNEEDFIAFVLTEHTDMSNKIVINSAQKGTRIGRKSLIPAICDLFGITYVGSNPYVVSLCRDKYRCGCILAQNGISVPQAWLYQPAEGWFLEPPTTDVPLIVKPNYEAASIGIDASSICNGFAVNEKVRQLASIYHQEIVAERFISGYEVEVPVIVSHNVATDFFPVGINLDSNKKMGNRILDYNLRGVDAYDYYDFTLENPQAAQVVLDATIRTAQILNINGFGRVDFRILDNGETYVTDIATNPHYTVRSSYEYLFKQLGLNYDDMIACLVATSVEEKA